MIYQEFEYDLAARGDGGPPMVMAALEGLETALCGCLKALDGSPKQRHVAYQRTLLALANLSRVAALADGILDPLPDEPDLPDGV